MFNRKARRIAALEAEVIRLRDGLAVAVIKTGPFGLNQRIEVEVGKWYHLSYRFRHTGAPTLDLDALLLEEAEPVTPFFEGDLLPRYSWDGVVPTPNPR